MAKRKDAKKKDIVEAGKKTRFGQPGAPSNRAGGRRRKLKNILKREGYAAADVRAAALILASMSEDDLKNVVEDKSKPAIFRITGDAFLKGLKKSGGLRLVKELLEIVGVENKTADGGPVEIIIKRENGGE
jgi:hypothetical protein